MKKHYIIINGTEIYYEMTADKAFKDTIVLIHGFLSSTFSYRKLIPLLQEEFNVLAVDYPPFGKSEASTKFHYSTINIANTILQLLDRLNIQQCYAVGHSMGGQIVLNMLTKQPNRINKAILLCSSGYIPRTKRSLVFLSYLPFFSRFVQYRLEKVGVLGNLQQVVYDKTLIDQHMIAGYAAPFKDDLFFKALMRMLRHRENDLTSSTLQSITTPCLLIWGENDRIVPLNIGKELANDLPYSKLLTFENTGHLLPEEKPVEVTCAIKKFIFQKICN